MIGAFIRAEYETVDFEEIGRRFRSLLAKDDSDARRVAVNSLLGLVLSVQSEGADAALAAQDAVRHVAVDQDNLVSRLAYAVLADLQVATGQSPDALARFESMRENVDGKPEVRRAEIYVHTVFTAWQRALDGRFQRPDVAASLGWQSRVFMRGDLRIGPWTALPVMADRILALRDELRRANLENEAARCEDWLASCAIGILKTESDAPTRLLAAELLATAAESDPKIRAGAVRFRTDYIATAERADVDFCIGGAVNARSIAPSEYRAAVSWLTAAGSLAATGIGAAVTLVLTWLLMPIVALVRLRRGGEMNSSPQTSASRAAWTAWTISSGVVALVAAVFTWRFARDQQGSESGLVLAALLLAGAGGAISVLAAALRSGDSRIGKAASIAAAAIFALALAMPISTQSHAARFLFMNLGSEWLLLPVVVGIIATAAILCGASLRSIASGAIATWLIAMLLATVAYQIHGAADRRYQTAAVAGHADEIAARLGADWQTRYFADALARYDPAQK